MRPLSIVVVGTDFVCVAKDLSTDRLILDARPANLLQDPPNKYIFSMASSQLLLGLFLEEDQKLLMTADDPSIFFYTCTVSEQRATKTFLEWLVPTCEFAETSHPALGVQCGALCRECLLTMHGVIPRGIFFPGVIIVDDLFFFWEKAALTSTVGKVAGRSRAAMHSVYHAVGLEPDVDGLEGLVRANVARAMSLCWVILQVCKFGVVSYNLHGTLAGGFAAIFSFRRRLLSCLDVIYAVQVGRDRKDMIRMPSQLVDELLSLVAMAPLAVTDIRAGFSQHLYAVDASNWGDAVIKAHVGKHIFGAGKCIGA